MGPWWLYILVFVFGYLTHKTFYFLRSIKISIGLIRVSQLISLGVLAKSMENFYGAHTLHVRQMRESERSEGDIRDARRSFNEEIRTYKEEAIKQMLDLHPKFYEPIIDFDDWKSGMKYLEKNKDFVTNLFGVKNDD